jgi:hypothetical protein
MSRLLPLAALVFGLTALTACDSDADAAEADPVEVDGDTVVLGADLPEVSVDDYEDYLAQRAALVAQVDSLIGNAEASSARACVLLPLGQTACGAVRDYRAMSRENEDAREIVTLAEEVAALDLRAALEFEEAATCEETAKPSVQYRRGQCVAMAGPPVGSSR